MVTPSTEAQKVAEYVSDAMAAKGITVKGLARETGIARTTLVRRLTGNSPFTIHELGLIATHLGMTASSLLAAADEQDAA